MLKIFIQIALKNILIIISCTLTLIAFTGCKKKAGLFAPEFVCKVDGDRFKPSKNGDFKADPLDAVFNDTSLWISGRNSPLSVSFNIKDKNGITIKEYLLNNNQSFTNFGSHGNFTDTYLTDSLHIGTVKIINIDYDKEIISGKFEFTAKHSWKNETVKITDGKFNVSFSR